MLCGLYEPTAASKNFRVLLRGIGRVVDIDTDTATSRQHA
jgi:hypothetical protein